MLNSTILCLTGVVTAKGNDGISQLFKDVADHYCNNSQQFCVDILAERNVDVQNVLEYVNRGECFTCNEGFWGSLTQLY